MSLLTIAQDIAGEVKGIVAPTTVFDQANSQFRALIQLAAEELARSSNWNALVRIHSFQTVATAAQPGSIPEDFDRFPVGETMRAPDLRLAGPATPFEWAWQAATANPISGARWRLINGQINLDPAPPAGQTITYEYLTRNFIRYADGTEGNRFKADTDELLLPEYLVRLGAKWRFIRAKGLDYAEEMSDFEREREKAAGRDTGTQIVFSSRRPMNDIPPALHPGVIIV